MGSESFRTLAEVAFAVMVINLPFGWWRYGTRRFSLPWILAVHLPIPIVIGLRILSQLGWQPRTFPVLIGAYFLGQFLGGRLHRWRLRKSHGSA